MLKSAGKRHATLVILSLVFFAAGVFDRSYWYPVILLVLAAAGLYLRAADAFPLALVCALTLLLGRIDALNRFWPLPLACALAAGLVAAKAARFAEGSFDWARKGDFGGRQAVIVAVIAAISGISLVLWYEIASPDVSDLARIVPHVRPIWLLVTGVIFSISNAVCEEFFWRGMIFNALERAGFAYGAVNSIQALSFGAAHLHGFPRGVSGMVLAGIYGYVLGLVRRDAKGLMAPVAAHAFADLVIYWILASVA